jgi:hypothetical protein
MLIKQVPDADIAKGKMVIDQGQGFKKPCRMEDGKKKVRMKWSPPAQDEAKLNVDGAFSGQGQEGAGIILRDDRGKVIIAACMRHDKCYDALEAELLAIEERLQLSMHWTNRSLTV